MSTAYIIWTILCDYEVGHGGPLKTRTVDIRRHSKAAWMSMTTIRRALWALHTQGLVRIADDTRGARAWMLTEAGREPRGLPNTHGASEQRGSSSLTSDEAKEANGDQS